MKKILILLIIIFGLCSCHKNEIQEENHYQKIDNKTMLELMENNNYVILDVRSNEEFSGGHIKGAQNIPYDKLEESVLPTTDVLFVYCASGGRSKIAAESLIELGYTVYDLGGIDNIDLPKE